MERFRRFDGFGNVEILNLNQLTEINRRLQELGLTVNQIDDLFGSASTSLDQFALRLDLVSGKNTSAIASFKELIDVQQIFLQVINTIQGAIAGAVAGTDSLGDALLAGFLRIVAGIASVLGTLFLLAGAGFIALPGFQLTAKQLFIAGAALIAFAGVLGGLASKIESKNAADKLGSNESQSSGSSFGSSNGGSSGGLPTTSIPLPTSGPRDQVTNIHLDAQASRAVLKELLDGKGYVSIESAQGKHRAALKKATRGR